jgi:hypothetical protein
MYDFARIIDVFEDELEKIARFRHASNEGLHVVQQALLGNKAALKQQTRGEVKALGLGRFVPFTSSHRAAHQAKQSAKFQRRAYDKELAEVQQEVKRRAQEGKWAGTTRPRFFGTTPTAGEVEKATRKAIKNERKAKRTKTLRMVGGGVAGTGAVVAGGVAGKKYIDHRRRTRAYGGYAGY